MAAVQWKGGKSKSIQQIKAWFLHNDGESRQEVHHTNPDINKAMTKENFTYRGLDYVGICQAFDERLESVDVGRIQYGENQGRVYLQSVLVYLPKGLEDADIERKKAWFRRAGDILDAQFGQNFLEMQVDMDENHWYTDPETKERILSREHGHARLFPEVDGKLNAKKFSSRTAINDLNNDLHKMTVQEFGCPYMDGSKRKGGKKVEDMKVASAAAEIIAQAEVNADQIRAAARREVQERMEYLEGLEVFCKKWKFKDGTNIVDRYNAKRPKKAVEAPQTPQEAVPAPEVSQDMEAATTAQEAPKQYAMEPFKLNASKRPILRTKAQHDAERQADRDRDVFNLTFNLEGQDGQPQEAKNISLSSQETPT